MAVTDATGVLLWVEGAHALRSNAEAMNFVEGARWSEDCAGTNAPGTALALDRPVQVFAAEHFSRIVQPWTCSAAPIHDPVTGELLGIIDLTGGYQIGSPHARALVQATVAAAESELRLLALRIASRNAAAGSRTSRKRSAARSSSRMEVLGRDDAILSGPSGTIRLSQRHAELLLLIMTHPAGLSVEQLSSHLSGERIGPRDHPGGDVAPAPPPRGRLHQLASLPHRRRPHVGLRGRAFPGTSRFAAPCSRCLPRTVLPGSTSPGIVEIREDFRAELRQALLQTSRVDPALRLRADPGGMGRRRAVGALPGPPPARVVTQDNGDCPVAAPRSSGSGAVAP